MLASARKESRRWARSASRRAARSASKSVSWVSARASRSAISSNSRKSSSSKKSGSTEPACATPITRPSAQERDRDERGDPAPPEVRARELDLARSRITTGFALEATRPAMPFPYGIGRASSISRSKPYAAWTVRNFRSSSRRRIALVSASEDDA